MSVTDRKALEGLLWEACKQVGYTRGVELPTDVAVALARLIGEAALAERDASRSKEPLFMGRVPEAAALQLAVVLPSSTEDHLLALERLSGMKRASRSELARVRDACDKLVSQCADLGVEPVGLRGAKCVRLAAAMKSLDEQG